MKKKEALKYSQAIEELNSILEGIESERIDIDEISLKVKRALELINLCRSRIRDTEMEVKKVLKEFDTESAEKQKTDGTRASESGS